MMFQTAKMPSLISTCEELYDTQDLYAVLGVDKKANAAQIKKAYHKVSTVCLRSSDPIYIVVNIE